MLGIGVGALLGGSLPARASNVPKIGDAITLPAVTLIDGRVLPASHWRGKVVLVEKFATWCPFCRVMNPKIDKFYRQYRNRGLETLFLSIDRNPSEVPKYLKERNYIFPTAMWTADWEGRLGAVKGLPIFWIIGRDGRLKQIESGELLDEDVAEFARWLD